MTDLSPFHQALNLPITSRTGANTIPSDDFFPNHREIAHPGPVESKRTPPPSQSLAKSPISKNSRTGCTMDEISPFHAVINCCGNAMVFQKALVIKSRSFSVERLKSYMEAGDEGCCGLILLSNWDDLDVGVEEEVEARYVVPTSEVYADIEKMTGVRLWSLWWSGNGVGMASGAVTEKNRKREMETALQMMTTMTPWCACDVFDADIDVSLSDERQLSLSCRSRQNEMPELPIGSIFDTKFARNKLTKI